MNIQFQPNTLYYGDCLEIMADFPNNSIDLICLDPPFNSNEKYHTIFKGSGLRNIDPQIKAFDDMWLWDPTSAQRVQEVKNAVANPASKIITAFEIIIPQSKMLSYTSYMAQRLFVMHRILKDTGSIYLHCDPTASHYLKLLMDAVFGAKNFLGEIIWNKSNGVKTRTSWGNENDNLLSYAKQIRNHTFNSDNPICRIPYSKTSLEMHFKNKDKNGRHYRRRIINGKTYIYYADKGRFIGNLWNDIPSMIANSPILSESLGYPTQKPRSLYERIIETSSNRGDLILDPFCGCGTTLDAALKNGRRAIGIDILPFALRLINTRREGVNLPVQGIPVDMDTARQLARSEPFKFQDWAISLINGLASNSILTGDDGVDGFGMLLHNPDNMDKRGIVVQVTGASGSQRAKFDRLQTTIRHHNAAIGILITLDAQPASRNWRHDLEPVRMGKTTYPPIQIFSIEEYFRLGEQAAENLLRLPALTDPWTGREMQKSLFE